MLKRLSLIALALIMCLSCLVACNKDDKNDDNNAGTEATLEEAVAYLNNIYKDNAKETPRDYDVVGKIIIGNTEFTVSWKASIDSITIKDSKKANFFTVDVPDTNETAIDYVLTATVKDSAGNTMDKAFNRTLPVINNEGIVTDPVADTPYKLFLDQVVTGKLLFALSTAQNNKYIDTTPNAKDAPDFYVEIADGGYVFYTRADSKTLYVYATTKTEDGNTSKYLGFSETEKTVWTYESETNCYFTEINGEKYVMGTYKTYDTFSISAKSFITAENSGKTQFPAGLMTKEYAESLKAEDNVQEKPYKTEKEIVEAAYALEKGAYLEGGIYTLTGVIVTVDDAYSAQYGNVTFTIVVGDMEDKPIKCYRVKGSGADKIKAGDTATVSGTITNYNGTIEFDSGCTLDSYTVGDGSNLPETPTFATPEELVNAAYALELGKSLNNQTLQGVVTEVNTAYDEQYKNVTFTIVVGNLTDKPIECFRVKGDAAATVKAGDTVTVTGNIINYASYNEDGSLKFSKIEFNAGATFVIDVVADAPENPDTPDTPENPTFSTPEEIVNAAYALAPGGTLGTQTLQGVVTKINTAYDASYKNVTFTIVVGNLTDKPIECFRVKGDAAATVKAGDTVTVTGELLNYESANKVEFDAGSTFVIDVVAEAPETPDTPTFSTPEEIVNAAYALEAGATLGTQTLQGIVTEVNTPYDSNYKNVTFTIVVGNLTDKPIECFRVKGDAASTVKAGDTVTVTGELLRYASYNDDGTLKYSKVEFNAGATFVIDVVADAPETPETPDTPDTPGTSEHTGNNIVLSVDTLAIPSQKYQAGTATIEGAEFEFIQMGNYGDGLQMRDKNGNTSIIWNTTAFAKGIARIELVYSDTKDVTYSNADAVVFTFGNAVGEATYTTKLSTTAGTKTYTITPDAETYTFFKLEHDLGYTMYWKSITIVFADGTTATMG